MNIYDNNALCGYKAVTVLDKYISKLEKRKVVSLMEKQRKVLIKAAKALRTTVVQPSDHCTTLSSVSKFKVNDNERTIEL
jgi:hypothetical protein